jgi:hypothetical protein
MQRMKILEELSGPWRGMSIQDGVRISEGIRFWFQAGVISGEGSDRDGEFRMTGRYQNDGTIGMMRVYHVCNHTPEAVGIPYEYRGVWNGSFIEGRWFVVSHPNEGGPFEMWPEREVDLQELAIHFHQRELIQA